MELERLSVALRPRNNWEAVDLGVRFAMQHARPLYTAWLAVNLPVAAVLYLLSGWLLDDFVWAGFVLWWLKPAFDRVAVYVISHAVFGEIPTPRATLRALPRLLWSSRLLAGLTWARLSPWRSINLPVDVLEGLRGRAARQRKSLLGRRISSTALGQTFVWLKLELILWLGLMGLLLMLVPESLMPEGDHLWRMVSEAPMWFSLLLYLPFLACTLFLEPLYVAGGFMLYIKRRTDLEAWDVELQLRRIAHARASEQAQALASNFLTLLLCATLAFGALAPPWVHAADEAALREQAVQQSSSEIVQVMKDPAFGKNEVRQDLRWRKGDETEVEEGTRQPGWAKVFADNIAATFRWLGEVIATLGRIGGWLLITAAVGLILFLATRFGWGRARAGRYVPPAELAGFDIRPESLPEDIATAARALLRDGQTRAALSLLFRGTLSRLAHQEQVPFIRGDTEGDCLVRVRQHAPARAAFLARLLGGWQQLAYAHRALSVAEGEALCQEWWREFGGGPA